MKIRSTIIVLTIVTLVLGVSAFAKKEPGDLDAPTITNVNIDTVGIYIEWTEVEDAVKYSVDIEGEVTYDDEYLGEVTADVELSFSSDDLFLVIGLDELAEAIASELGIDPEDVLYLDGEVKVKGLAPGNGNGRQNNLFSDSWECDVDFED